MCQESKLHVECPQGRDWAGQEQSLLKRTSPAESQAACHACEHPLHFWYNPVLGQAHSQWPLTLLQRGCYALAVVMCHHTHPQALWVQWFYTSVHLKQQQPGVFVQLPTSERTTWYADKQMSLSIRQHKDRGYLECSHAERTQKQRSGFMSSPCQAGESHFPFLSPYYLN